MKYAGALMVSIAILALPMFVGAQFNPTRGAAESNLSTLSFYDLLVKLMQYLLVILTILGVLGFIISGIIFITAGGAGKADMARSWLYYSIFGIIVGLIGFIVIRLIDGILRGTADNA